MWCEYSICAVCFKQANIDISRYSRHGQNVRANLVIKLVPKA